MPMVEKTIPHVVQHARRRRPRAAQAGRAGNRRHRGRRDARGARTGRHPRHPHQVARARTTRSTSCYATFEALKSLKTAEHVAQLRGKTRHRTLRIRHGNETMADETKTASYDARRTPQARTPHSAGPKRTRVGRGHGSGMVKTGGEGGKGQTVRSGGGKGPGVRRRPDAVGAASCRTQRGYSQKARDIGHFRQTFAVVNLGDLAGWDVVVEVSPQSLRAARPSSRTSRTASRFSAARRPAARCRPGLKFRDVLFSATAREALTRRRRRRSRRRA